ncbi:low molecular weight protein tyrosine phosphatase family protein [Burkholderia contaminans]|uniref:Low molecular weight protein tyrosine phosphatase family protein n=1 Tax=Burkholderia contaminans TaxID=488447 RepID=A0AAP4VFX6_9BURK|nr:MULTISPECIES: low molecular weight protein tyrosine phosphatase family protein [Burkholderia]MBD1416337.1 phosphotyrosine protein phosphatase [Burkholderia contaminans]MBH9667625.1 low molecular weight protein tyrosine phosphatase family protein [Burkholderia contaminans]MBH9674987.1 low molecular weight protein tyrosine phosphatase family protein [Burkholderia contaminans]MBH9705009.1 low molecular weight protein tyrosine phosphatase family protein [Burkholderia contaminans]MBH9722086.1 lo
MTRALFLCSRNRLRSPTAEAVFAAWPGIETDSAGLAPDADTRVSAEQLDWADVVFVMERAHQARLAAQFGAHLRHKKIVCLDIPDRYAYMQPELVTLLERKAGPLLRA